MKKSLWSSGEIADEKNCTVANINRIVGLNDKLKSEPFSIWVGGRRLFTDTGRHFFLNMQDGRRK
jgi:hypothetical protein